MSAPKLGPTVESTRQRRMIDSLAKAIDYADAYRAIRYLVRGDGGRLSPDTVWERVLALVMLRDAVLEGDHDHAYLRDLAGMCGQPETDEPSDADGQIIDEIGALRDQSCALQHVHDILSGAVAEGEPWPYPLGAPVSIVTDKARDVVEGLNACADKLADNAADKPSPGWERREVPEHGHDWIRWQHASGWTFDMRKGADGRPCIDSLDVDAGVSLHDLGALLLIEARRGLS